MKNETRLSHPLGMPKATKALPAKGLRRKLSLAKAVFLSFLRKLSPARRVAYLGSLVAFVWGYLEADWAGAIEYARARPEVDAERIALWGTSFSGGHVVVAAARDGRVRCISAQCPSTDGRAGMIKAMHSAGIANGLKLVVHGQRDQDREHDVFAELESPGHVGRMEEVPGAVLVDREDRVEIRPSRLAQQRSRPLCSREADG